ncbi:MAG: nucleoside recognition domain-containing protein [Leadbetterella sp.]
MALNYLWVGFFIVGFAVGFIKLIFFGDTEIFKILIDGIFESAEMSIMKIALPLAGVMTFFMGLLKIGENAGVINMLARIISPFFSRVFPEVPQGHKANGEMIMNFSANMLGLDNASTPFGLSAMKSLQELNPKPDTASNSQIMFMVLHSAGPVLIPLSIIAQRAIYGAANPTDIFIPALVCVYVATFTGLLITGIKQKINFLDTVLLSWLGGITLFIVGLLYWFSSMNKDQVEITSKILSNTVLAVFILGFLLAAIYKKVDIFPSFIEGAKQGWQTTVNVMPYLVGMLVAISVLRNSGTLTYITDGLKYAFGNWAFFDGLPTALMHPLSGSGSRGMMIDAMKTFGPDSFAGRLSCVFQASSDTILYILALYFGSVGIKHTRYTLAVGLLADLAGVITGILVSYLFFG